MTKPDTQERPAVSSAVPYLALGAALVACLALFAFHRIEAFDTYLHMAAGRWILSERAFPHANLFMYTARGHRWVDHEWLSQVLLVLIYRRAGPVGLQVFAWVGYSAAFGLMLGLWRRLGVRAELAAVPSLLAILLPLGRYSPRPELFSSVFLAITIVLLLTWRETAHRGIWALPFLTAAAANCHGGVIAGLGFLWVFTLGEGIQALVRRRWSHPAWPGMSLRQWRVLALVAVTSTLALLLNPYGPAWYEAVSPSQIRFLSSYLEEWQPLLGPGVQQRVALPVFYAFLGLLGLSFVFSRRWTLSHLAAAAVFAASAFLSRRNLSPLALVGLGVMAGNLSYANLRTDAKGRQRTVGRALAALGLALGLIVLGFGLSLPGLRWLGVPRPLGLGSQPNVLPVRAERFLETHRLPARIFNEIDYGAYLAWARPHQPRLFIDGLNAFGPSVVGQYLQITRLGPQALALIERWEINTFFLPQPDLARRNPGQPTIYSFLAESPEWRLVFWDGVSVIYVRDTPATQGLIRRFGYRYLDPGNPRSPGYAKHRAEVAAELARATAASPDAPYLRVLAGFAYLGLELPEQAAEQFMAALHLAPDYGDAYTGLGLLTLRAGRIADSETMFREAARLAPDEAAPHRGLAQIAEMRGDARRAAAEWRKVLARHPDPATARLAREHLARLAAP